MQIFLLSVVILSMLCCCATTIVDDQLNDKKTNDSILTESKDVKRSSKSFNYLRLPEGECHNCSTYKCTNNKLNMGGSDWCIMLFSDAVNHCDSDVNCGGYTMTTGEWFHKKYDKNSQVAVHLTKAGEKSIRCPLAEWSSYDKQNVIRHTPVIYGRSTCENGNQDKETCDKSTNYNYVFESNSNVVVNDKPYLCKTHPNNVGIKDVNCILSIVDGVKLCNSDDQCEGFVINIDQNWEKKYSNNGMQAVELFGKDVSYTPNQTSRIFKKQF